MAEHHDGESALEQTVETVAQAVAAVVESVDTLASTLDPLQPQGTAIKDEGGELGLYATYGALLLMAVVPIIVGARRSVVAVKAKDENGQATTESMTSHDAKMFPIIASCMLFGLYVVFKLFSPELVNFVLTGYFMLLGVFALAKTIRQSVEHLAPAILVAEPFRFQITRSHRDNPALKADWFDLSVDFLDLACLALAAVVGAWYLFTKHWIANNIFGLVFATNAIELLALGSFKVGAILLSGLFIYDIFWVFGTNVMVTVARSFDAPVKLVFPKDIFVHGFAATNHAMLGLGDIVIPGIVIALLLRFDRSRSQTAAPYFSVGMLAYFVGLATTIFVMHVFKAAQPALLYLVPTCLGFPVVFSWLRGEFGELNAYQDNPDEEEEAGEEDKAQEGAEQRPGASSADAKEAVAPSQVETTTGPTTRKRSSKKAD
ncbi:hypothetical protein CAOG_008391 [Capsaspora owczarzaki ATCC 30864]|uniref:Signal peptide peptidase n=2 Tax=Capsaspora owczarzaki (strain ATCC 30864) TaxID=595528 RepID=A0A0D2WGG3_CAPO3|nr:hypothetical protein CAOG_008391 [Capsaspora owczarzaki ATCC 30864]